MLMPARPFNNFSDFGTGVGLRAALGWFRRCDK